MLIKCPPLQEGLVWQPRSDAQATAIQSPAQMLLFGGAAGGGKSLYLIADAAQERDNPRLRALILRRSFAEMGDLIDKMKDVYRPLGASSSQGGQLWRFPSGAEVRLGYLAADEDIERYRGVEFSYLGVDEAGSQSERRVRRIMAWLRSSDPSITVRVRLTANPDGIGSNWLKHVFLHNRCPVHQPCNPKDPRNTCVEPGRLYKGATWLSDGAPIPFTTSFIPARVTDHNLLGESYVENLRMQEGGLAKQLLDGCWCVNEGGYFPFLTPDFKQPAALARLDWWNSYMIGLDFGFSGSAAAATFFGHHDNGVVYQVGELLERKMPANEFAHAVCEKFVIPTINGSRRRISACYIDPANTKHIGTGQSVADQIEEVFELYGVPLIAASNDRAGGWQKLYRLLLSKQLVITDLCPKTFTAFASRIHDPKKPGDLIKVHGEDLDDLVDSVRYAINSFAETTVVPREIAAMQRIEEMREAGLDETSLSHYILQAQMEGRTPEFKPMRIGGGRSRTIRR